MHFFSVVLMAAKSHVHTDFSTPVAKPSDLAQHVGSQNLKRSFQRQRQAQWLSQQVQLLECSLESLLQEVKTDNLL
eukprot:2177790-Amphidinium_carterae.3